jgi:hypothetical protein
MPKHNPLTEPQPRGKRPYWCCARRTEIELKQLELMQQLERAARENRKCAST